MHPHDAMHGPTIGLLHVCPPRHVCAGQGAPPYMRVNIVYFLPLAGCALAHPRNDRLSILYHLLAAHWHTDPRNDTSHVSYMHAPTTLMFESSVQCSRPTITKTSKCNTQPPGCIEE